MTATAPVLSVRELVKAYYGRSVLDGVDLDVDEHEVVVLIGASGSGKSTLLRCVDLLEDIDDGQILLDAAISVTRASMPMPPGGRWAWCSSRSTCSPT